MTTITLSQTLLRRHIALPQDHGSWVFLFSPLLIGLFAGRAFTVAGFFLFVAACAAFLVRQPVTIATKAYSGRRARRELPAAWFWIAVYSLVGLLALAGLAWLGFGYLLLLALPGLPVFAWHLWLVSRRQERRQMGIELVGSGVLALSAPAAYWVGVGSPDPLGWWLLALAWIQSAASIVYAYLRLKQRELPAVPPLPERLRMGSRALLYTTFNLLFAAGLSVLPAFPMGLALPYALQWLETLYGVVNPAVGLKPTRIGIRQLIVSVLFTVLFIVVWR